MSTATAPVVIYVPVAEAMLMFSWEGESVPAEWGIPVPLASHWRQVVQTIEPGDEIIVRAEVDGVPVIEVPAVVVSLDGPTQTVEVIA